MAKGMYVGISGKARKIKKGYVGIGGKARKIKKAYVGIGGKARPFWTGGQVEYYGTVTPLSAARVNLAGASVGNYALFAGGYNMDTQSRFSEVDAFNTSLIYQSGIRLSVAREYIASANVGNYVLFAGGSNGSTRYYYVDAFNTMLTRSGASNLRTKVNQKAGASVGNYALFSGGATSGAVYEDVDAYNADLIRSTAPSLRRESYAHVGGKVGNYALFMGGDASFLADAFNENLVRSDVEALDFSRESKMNLVNANAGDRILIAGGSSNIVEVYNASLTKTYASPLSVARVNLAGTSVNGCAIFAGGVSGKDLLETAEVYNAQLVKSVLTSKAPNRFRLAGASVGNYALFAGGSGNNSSGSSYHDTVSVYVV